MFETSKHGNFYMPVNISIGCWSSVCVVKAGMNVFVRILVILLELLRRI